MALGCDPCRVYVRNREGNIRRQLKITGGSFERVLNDTGTINLVGRAPSSSASCCKFWETAEDWVTEVIVMKDRRSQFIGPVTNLKFDKGIVTLAGEDFSARWKRTEIDQNFSYSNIDLGVIFNDLHNYYFSLDNPLQIRTRMTPAGQVGDREYVKALGGYLDTALRELATTGVDWYAFGRTIDVFGLNKFTGPSFTLLDKHWAPPPQVELRGDIRATRVKVFGGNGLVAEAVADRAYIQRYGDLYRRFDEPNILDQATLDQNAQARLALYINPLFINPLSSAVLDKTAPMKLEQLLPGMLINLNTKASCKKVVSTQRLKRITVDLRSAAVSPEFQPIGDFSTEAA